MKNFSLVLNIVLLVAVAVLFYLHFSTSPSSNGSGRSFDSTRVESAIAYIHTDSILQHYEYLKEIRDQLEDKTKKMDQDLRNRMVALQNDINAYQRNVNSMTLGQVRAAEEDLAKKRDNLQLYEQSLSQQLMEEQSKLNQALYERVTAFLKDYGEKNGLQMVLKYDPSSDVLYAGKPIDITDDVIRGLNESYKHEKDGNVKSDSTATGK